MNIQEILGAMKDVKMGITAVTFSLFDVDTRKESPATLEPFDARVFSAMCRIAQSQCEANKDEIAIYDKAILEIVLAEKSCDGETDKTKLLEKIRKSIFRMKFLYACYTSEDKARDIEFTEQEHLIDIKTTALMKGGKTVEEIYELATVPTMCKCPTRILQDLSIDESVTGLAKFADVIGRNDNTRDPFEW